MEEKEGKTQYRFHDKRERMLKMNKFVMMGIAVLLLVFLGYYWAALGNEEMPASVCWLGIGIVAISVLADILIYIKNKGSQYLKLAAVVEIGLIYLLTAVCSNVNFIHLALIGLTAACIPFYQKAFMRGLALSYGLLYLVSVMVRYGQGRGITGSDLACTVIITILVFYTIARTGSIGKVFSDHALGSVEEKQKEQKRLLEGVLDISKAVKEESEKGKEMMDELYDATKSMSASMNEISSATNMTAENITRQNAMTQDIQKSIDETLDYSQQVSEAVGRSEESIRVNMEAIEAMEKQSAGISRRNGQVNEAMERLQQKTNEVAEFAQMIFSISSQTNMLALNASIESARAGEAGKGFAVVAEQIRSLAEQTRSCTENISSLVSQLNENAQEAVESITISTNASEEQNGMIRSTAERFLEMQKDMEILLSGMSDINGRVDELSRFNSRVVENLTQVSAATQEVTASSDQANHLSGQNLEVAREAKHTIDMIQQKTGELEKYL